jgi:DinB superfamily
MSAYRERMLSLLGDRSPGEAMDAARKRIEELVDQLGEEGFSRSYGPGKWTAREILVHLADAELTIGFRLRQALAQQNHTVQAFDQDVWARRYASYDARLAARTFGAVRLWNLALIRTLSPEDLAKPVMHPERGIESVGTIIRMLAGHDLNHLAQLEQIAGQKKPAARRES